MMPRLLMFFSLAVLAISYFGTQHYAFEQSLLVKEYRDSLTVYRGNDSATILYKTALLDSIDDLNAVIAASTDLATYHNAVNSVKRERDSVSSLLTTVRNVNTQTNRILRDTVIHFERELTAQDRTIDDIEGKYSNCNADKAESDSLNTLLTNYIRQVYGRVKMKGNASPTSPADHATSLRLLADLIADLQGQIANGNTSVEKCQTEKRSCEQEKERLSKEVTRLNKKLENCGTSIQPSFITTRSVTVYWLVPQGIVSQPLQRKVEAVIANYCAAQGITVSHRAYDNSPKLVAEATLNKGNWFAVVDDAIALELPITNVSNTPQVNAQRIIAIGQEIRTVKKVPIVLLLTRSKNQQGYLDIGYQPFTSKTDTTDLYPILEKYK